MGIKGVPAQYTQEEIRQYLDDNPAAEVIMLDIDDTTLKYDENTSSYMVVNEAQLAKALTGHVVFFVTKSPSDPEMARQDPKSDKKIAAIQSFVERHRLISNDSCIATTRFLGPTWNMINGNFLSQAVRGEIRINPNQARVGNITYSIQYPDILLDKKFDPKGYRYEGINSTANLKCQCEIQTDGQPSFTFEVSLEEIEAQSKTMLFPMIFHYLNKIPENFSAIEDASMEKRKFTFYDDEKKYLKDAENFGIEVVHVNFIGKVDKKLHEERNTKKLIQNISNKQPFNIKDNIPNLIMLYHNLTQNISDELLEDVKLKANYENFINVFISQLKDFPDEDTQVIKKLFKDVVNEKFIPKDNVQAVESFFGEKQVCDPSEELQAAAKDLFESLENIKARQYLTNDKYLEKLKEHADPTPNLTARFVSGLIALGYALIAGPFLGRTKIPFEKADYAWESPVGFLVNTYNSMPRTAFPESLRAFIATVTTVVVSPILVALIPVNMLLALVEQLRNNSFEKTVKQIFKSRQEEGSTPEVVPDPGSSSSQLVVDDIAAERRHKAVTPLRESEKQREETKAEEKVEEPVVNSDKSFKNEL